MLGVRVTYWLPNSDAMKRKPVRRTHMAAATGTVSKYFNRISVTWKEQVDFDRSSSSRWSVAMSMVLPFPYRHRVSVWFWRYRLVLFEQGRRTCSWFYVLLWPQSSSIVLDHRLHTKTTVIRILLLFCRRWSYASSRYGTTNIRLITEVFECDIILWAHQYSTRSFGTTRDGDEHVGKFF